MEGRGRAVVYGRTVDDGGHRWLQYWSYYAYNSQDRGILRTGRHEGDWELVEYRLGANGRPDLGVYAQHSWREGCAGSRVGYDAGRPVVFVAHGSHAAYFRRGVHDRPWPDPNDHADAGGPAVRPAVVEITPASPAWMRRRERWGDSKAAFPGEQSSPHGPAFQHDRFDHPAAYAAGARRCGSGAPPRQFALTLAFLLGGAWLASAVAFATYRIVARRRA